MSDSELSEAEDPLTDAFQSSPELSVAELIGRPRVHASKESQLSDHDRTQRGEGSFNQSVAT